LRSVLLSTSEDALPDSLNPKQGDVTPNDGATALIAVRSQFSAAESANSNGSLQNLPESIGQNAATRTNPDPGRQNRVENFNRY
jgi:hypothetical protein